MGQAPCWVPTPWHHGCPSAHPCQRRRRSQHRGRHRTLAHSRCLVLYAVRMSTARGFDEALGGKVPLKGLGADIDGTTTPSSSHSRDELHLNDDVLLELHRPLHLQRTIVLFPRLGPEVADGVRLVPPSPCHPTHSRRRVSTMGGTQWGTKQTRHRMSRMR